MDLRYILALPNESPCATAPRVGQTTTSKPEAHSGGRGAVVWPVRPPCSAEKTACSTRSGSRSRPPRFAMRRHLTAALTRERRFITQITRRHKFMRLKRPSVHVARGVTPPSRRRSVDGVDGVDGVGVAHRMNHACLLYTSPSPRDRQKSRMPSSA